MLLAAGISAVAQSRPGQTSTVNTVAVEPAEVTLYGGGQQTFSPLINGAPAKKNDVTWALSPVVGSINPTGNYRAPSVIDQPMEVTVVATSKANPTKSGTAKISLLPPPTPVAPTVNVSISPSSGELNPAQTLALSATVDGASDQRVTWKLDPTVGSLAVSGNQAVYTAPAEIAQQQTVTVEAVSVYDSTKSAKALLTLIPAIAITVQPASVELTEGQNYQFSAQVTGTTNQGVTWSLDQAVGSISSGGLYSAPASVGAPTAVKVIAKSNADGTKTSSATANVSPASKVQFTIDDLGLTSLSYDGQSYFLAASSVMAQQVTFQTAAGVRTIEPWQAVTAAARTMGTNPPYFEHTYNKGLPHEFTVRVIWLTPDSRTLEAQITIRNGDKADELVSISLDLLRFRLPGPAIQFQYETMLFANQFTGRPTQFLSGSWGSLAFWLRDYPTNANLGVSYRKADQTDFPVMFGSSSTVQGTEFLTSIPPGHERNFSYVLRFGGPNETEASLAADALAQFRAAFPQIPDWVDRRPIGLWYISEGTTRSEVNPRGYLWDSTLRVSDSINFRTRILAKTDDIINRMNRMRIRPQGIIIWDLEGQEFAHAFTYVGYPSKLNHMAPELDQVADEMFSRVRAAGYTPGLTIRPQDFMTGTELPATCESRESIWVSDKFVKVDATYPYRSYRCISPNVWEVTSRGPGTQTAYDDTDKMLSLLREKVRYAYTRWGVKLFYVDSNVDSRGRPLISIAFRQLASEFSDCLFIPEMKNDLYYGLGAPYTATQIGGFGTPEHRRVIYPQAFSAVVMSAVSPTTDNVTKLVEGVRRGDILMFPAWFDTYEVDLVDEIYRQAEQ